MSSKAAFAYMYGQMQGMLDLMTALLATHPDSKSAYEAYEKFRGASVQRAIDGERPDEFLQGMAWVQAELAKVQKIDRSPGAPRRSQ
ncbi:hypothetical protein [Methylomagnum ishizawai]|uniref:hypothetical protein n=1 Tax=Methylomagnum ishizawai TaxID=1760988 RepID=UPI000A157EEC|nr:hypothetical protein [Methylomagnum ishizawai]